MRTDWRSGMTPLEEALARHGKPDIFNTAAGIRISMDGRGRWMDNVFIERLWRSLKYECVFLNAFETGSEARTGIGCWIRLLQQPHRPHIFDLRRQDARRGLCYAGKRAEIGGVIEPRIDLSQAAKLFWKPGPSLHSVRA